MNRHLGAMMAESSGAASEANGSESSTTRGVDDPILEAEPAALVIDDEAPF